MKSLILCIILMVMVGCTGIKKSPSNIDLAEESSVVELDVDNNNAIDTSKGGTNSTSGELDPKVDTSAEIQAIIGASVYQASGSYLTAYLPRHYMGAIPDPYNQYAKSVYIPLQISTDEAITITRIEVQCKSDPTTELNWNLMYADNFITLANPVLIRSMDTTAGALNVTTGWGDNTVAQGKCVYILFDAQPGVNTPITAFEITFE